MEVRREEEADGGGGCFNAPLHGGRVREMKGRGGWAARRWRMS